MLLHVSDREREREREREEGGEREREIYIERKNGYRPLLLN